MTWQRTGLVVANTVAVVAALILLNDVSQRVESRFEYVGYDAYPGTLVGPYGPVSDVFVYDAAGNPIEGAMLLDQDGRPLAPQVCDRYCPSLTFPLTGAERPLLATPSASPTPAPAVSPTPSATPSPKARPTATPSATRRR